MKLNHRIFRYFICLVMISVTLGCGSGSSQNNHLTNELSGSWLSAQPDEYGERILIEFGAFQNNECDSTFHIIAVDGTDVGSVPVHIKLDGSEMIVSIEGLEPERLPFSIADNVLTIDGIEFHPMQNGSASLSGEGGISGTLSAPTAIGSLSRSHFIPGEILVVYKTASSNLNALTTAMTSKSESDMNRIDWVKLEMPQRNKNIQALSLSQNYISKLLHEVITQRQWTLDNVSLYSKDPNVLFAQPNFVHRVLTVPNDEHYAKQWHYPLIHLPEAWDTTTGDSATVIAVVDSGVRFDHPDLANSFTQDGYDFVSDPNMSGDGDGIDSDPSDPGSVNPVEVSVFHGTHVSGTIAAQSNNTMGVAGINWQAKILPVRSMTNSMGTSDDIANGILYAAGLPNSSGTVPNQAADVINLSLGSDSTDMVIDSAIAQAIQAGCVVVAASGNSNKVTTGSPAATPGVITVGATGIDGLRAPYSNYGPEIDVVAPGGNTQVDQDGNGDIDGILSTLYNDAGQPIYQYYDGTSMAAPHVTGVISLMLAVNPSLSSAQILQILKDTATDVGSAGRDDEHGYGLIHAARAVNAASNGTSLPAHLTIEPHALQLNELKPQGTFLIQNSGSGSITNLSLEILSIDAPGDWLSASIASDSQLYITTETSGLKDGNYQAQLRVQSDQGFVDVQVNLTIGASTTVQAGNIYVLALSATSNNVIAETTVDPNTLKYFFESLPIDTYQIFAGTDVDGNGYICEIGDLCGAYPSLEQAMSVAVTPNTLLDGLDIRLNELTNGIQSLKLGHDE